MSLWTKINPSAAAPAKMAPITLHTNVANFAVPAAGDGLGVDVTNWRDASGHAPSDADVEIKSNVATTIPGPVGIYGEKDDGTICLVEFPLNGGADIKVPAAGLAVCFQVAGVGIFKKLRIGGINGASVAAPAAQLTVRVTPISVVEKTP